MNSVPCALVVAFLVSVAIAAPTTTTDPSTTTVNGTKLDSMGIGQSVSIGDLGQFVVVFGVSPCLSNCIGNLSTAFNNTDSDTAKDHRHVTLNGLDSICENYFAAAACLRKCPKSDGHLFDIISAGANYMCVEEREAFDHAMPCIQEHKKDMKQECSQKCDSKLASSEDDEETTLAPHGKKTTISHSKKTLSPKSKKTTLAPTTPSSNSSDILGNIGELCEKFHCSIECGRDYLNEQCDKDVHAGNLVTEVIIRSLEKNAEYLKEQLSPEQEMSISQVLPQSCFFIVDEAQLDSLRDGWVPDDKKTKISKSDSSSTTKIPAKSSKLPAKSSKLPAKSTTFAPEEDISTTEDFSTTKSIKTTKGFKTTTTMERERR